MASAILASLVTLGTSVLPAQYVQATTAIAQRRSQTEIHVEPGSSTTIVLRMVNPETYADTLITTTTLPNAWRVATPEIQTGLSSGESQLEFITLAIPAATPAGRYVVRYATRAQHGGATMRDSVVIYVDRRDDLTIVNEIKPTFVVEGDPLDLTFYVVNGGNAPVSVALQATGQGAKRATLSWTSAQLEAGETRAVQLTAVQDADAGTMDRRAITLRALTSDNNAANLTVMFQVVPRGKDRAESRDFPMLVSVRAGTGKSTAIGRVEGRGYLNASQTIGMDFWYEGGERSVYFRAPNQYSVALRAPGVEIVAGNRFWELSPLTEPGRFDPGAGIKLNGKTLYGGGYFAAGSRRFVSGSQGGMYIGAHVNPKVDVSAQYMLRRTNAVGSGTLGSTVSTNATIATFRATVRPINGIIAEAEIGTGTGATGSGWGRSIGLSVNRGYNSFSVRHAKVSDEYPIWDRNLIGNSAAFQLQPFKSLRIHGAYNTIEVMHNPTSIFFIPDRRRGGYVGVGIGRYIDLSTRRDEWTNDTMSWGAGSERIAHRLQLRLPIGRFMFDPRVEFANTTQAGSAEDVKTVSAGAGISTRLPASGQLSVRVDRVKRRPSVKGSDWWTGLISGSFRPFLRTLVTLSASQSSFETPWDANARWLDASINQQVFGHRIMASVRSYHGQYSVVGAKTIYRLDYVLPVGVPLPAQTASGNAVIRLTESETGEPLPGVLIRIGNQAMVTDGRGVARFKSLPTGDNYLIVPPTSLGPGRITLQPMPMRLVITDKQTQKVEIMVARSSRISGKLRQFNEDPSVARALLSGQPSPNPRSAVLPGPNASASNFSSDDDDPVDKLVDAGGVVGAVIELVTTAGRRLTTTDAEGQFTFEHIPPGPWTLKVISANVPPFYYLDQKTIEGIGKPGDDTQVLFRIIPKRRTVSEQIVQQISTSKPDAEQGKSGGLSH